MIAVVLIIIHFTPCDVQNLRRQTVAVDDQRQTVQVDIGKGQRPVIGRERKVHPHDRALGRAFYQAELHAGIILPAGAGAITEELNLALSSLEPGNRGAVSRRIDCQRRHLGAVVHIEHHAIKIGDFAIETRWLNRDEQRAGRRCRDRNIQLRFFTHYIICGDLAAVRVGDRIVSTVRVFRVAGPVGTTGTAAAALGATGAIVSVAALGAAGAIVSAAALGAAGAIVSVVAFGAT